MRTYTDSEVESAVKQCTAILKDTRGLLVITGAGISAESGLPTYRGPGGAYEQNPELPIILSEEGWANDPRRVWQYLDDFRVRAAQAKPNQAHRILMQWEQERRFDRFLIATQNIDGLHQTAGSSRVSELHGSAWQMACPRSVDYADDPQFSRDAWDIMSLHKLEAILQRWSRENKHTVWDDRQVPFPFIPPYADPVVRPNIVLFGEGYGNRLLWVEDFIKHKPDTVLIIGCSGGVSILDRLVRACHEVNPGCAIININAHADPISLPHLHIPLSAVLAFENIHPL
jgi:NAD-dependent SIR2 family protein deacetylase